MTQTKKQTKRKVVRHKGKPNYTKQARRLQREALYSALLLILVIILIARFHSSPSHYKLVIYQEDAQMKEVQYYTSFKTAKAQMQKLIDQGEFNPAILNEDDQILAIRYGVVNFHTKTCDENTSYRLESDDSFGYTNGCYGADGAYLETDDTGSYVRFKQSGAIGWADIQDVEILNYYDSDTVKSINHYLTEAGNLFHYGTTDLHDASYALCIPIGKSELAAAGKPLFSYDGHYFYNDYASMIDDYRENTYENSINANAMHLNYFQYLSHRAKSSYVSKDLNWYISSYLGYQAKPTSYPANDAESQLFEEGYSFVEAQNTYGVNAVMMLSLAINESGYGRSQIAIEKNNLFGHAAYDSSPDESASGYKDAAAGITYHASVILNKGYLNPCDQSDPSNSPSPSACLNKSSNRYRGGYFGDKGSGMNVRYASDPYWGEKAAQYYRSIDELLGGKDEVRYTLKVLHNRAETPMYSQPDTSSKVLFYSPRVEDYALIVLGEVTGKEIAGNTTWYKVQSDGVLNNVRNALITDPENYHSNTDVVYVPAAYFES